MYKYNADKSYSYLKGFCMARGYTNSIRAMSFARRMHQGQERKNGEPYFIHPLTMANHAIALGIASDELIASLLLHDVLEDCNVAKEEIPVSDEILKVVRLVTFIKPRDTDKVEQAKFDYYAEIGENKIASLVKIIDRCHNVSTMSGVFTPMKVKQYIKETEEYVLPLIDTTKSKWPELSETLFVLKYHIHSVIDSLSSCAAAYENLAEAK